MRPRKLFKFTGLVRREESRAAFLQLTDTPTPILVSETDYGFLAGPTIVHSSARKADAPTLAGVFDNRIGYTDFHDAIEAAAVECMDRPHKRARLPSRKVA